MLMDARATCYRCRPAVDGRFPSARLAMRSGPLRWRCRSGTRHLHRLRQVHDRVPARGHTHESVPSEAIAGAPEGFLSSPSAQGSPRPPHGYRCGVDDCTGCGVCVDVMPREVQDRGRHSHKHGVRARSQGRLREHWDFFLSIPSWTAPFGHDSVKGSQSLQPLSNSRAPATAAARRRT